MAIPQRTKQSQMQLQRFLRQEALASHFRNENEICVTPKANPVAAAYEESRNAKIAGSFLFLGGNFGLQKPQMTAVTAKEIVAAIASNCCDCRALRSTPVV